jgi:hypothetical protein
MRVFRFTTALALLLTAFVAASAQSTAKGTYDFTLGDKNLKHISFDCQQLSGGGATGSLLMTDEATIVYQDVDGDGSPSEKYAGFSMSVSFDDMTLADKNQAIMSGVVRDSNIPYLIGLRVLFTVEDNGDGTRIPDRLTWGAYKEIKRDWTPSDAEWKEDPGVGLTWQATDAERRGDVGYKMPRDESITVQSFPFAAYDFVVTDDGTGDIVVTP